MCYVTEFAFACVMAQTLIAIHNVLRHGVCLCLCDGSDIDSSIDGFPWLLNGMVYEHLNCVHTYVQNMK